jgi:hypothetical protein
MIFREKRLLVSKPDEVTRIDGISRGSVFCSSLILVYIVYLISFFSAPARTLAGYSGIFLCAIYSAA